MFEKIKIRFQEEFKIRYLKLYIFDILVWFRNGNPILKVTFHG